MLGIRAESSRAADERPNEAHQFAAGPEILIGGFTTGKTELEKVLQLTFYTGQL